MENDICVLLITTGGTIAGKVAVTDGLQDNAAKIREAGDFPDLLVEAIDSLKPQCNDRPIKIHTHTFREIDSSDIQPADWTGLANLIELNYEKYVAIIITHGTNTLGYTAAALSFAIPNSAKPIILTGSQVPAGVPGSDALTNLENSLRLAVWNSMDEKYKTSSHALRGVMAVFGSNIITGTRVKKNTEFDYDAFRSFGSATIGRIGRIIHLDDHAVTRHLSYLARGGYKPARVSSELAIRSAFDMNIASLTEFPGMSPDIMRRLVDDNGVKGIILRSFGAGDPSSVHRETLAYLKRQKVPVVITTQAPNGTASMSVNEPGKFVKDEGLGIPAYDMSIESQTTKLGWLLAQMKPGGIGYETLCERMKEDLRGEINTAGVD